MSYNNYENYYRDDNGKIHRDIPLGTAPGDAYVRTNTRLKEEIKRVDDRIDQSVEDINNRITNIDIAEFGIAEQIDHLTSRIDNIIASDDSTSENTELLDIRTGFDGKIYGSAGGAVRQQSRKNHQDINSIYTDLYDTTATENLYNSDLVTASLNVYDTGTFHYSESYQGVIIPIHASMGIISIIRNCAGGVFRAGTSAEFPADGVSVSQCSTYDTGNHMTIVPNAEDHYLYVVYYKSTNNISISDCIAGMKIFYGTTWSDSVSKLDRFINDNYVPLAASVNSIEQQLLSKPDLGSVLFLGDSYTADSYEGNNNGWINALTDYFVFSRKKIGVGSATVKDKYNDHTAYPYTDRPDASDNSGNHNTLSCQIEKLKRLIAGTDLDQGETQYSETPDIIFIQGGTNDAADTAEKEAAYTQQFYVPETACYAMTNNSTVSRGTVYVRPEIDQTDRTSFAGSIRYLYEELHRLYPDARIYFIAPSRLSYGTGNNIDSVKKTEQIKKVCSFLSIPVIDWGEDCGINYIDNYMSGSGTAEDPYIIKHTTEYSIDSLHPNEKAAKILAKKVCDKLKCDLF